MAQLLLLVAGAARAGDEPDYAEIRSDASYDVVGRTALAIRRSLDRERILALGEPFDAYTRTTLRWFHGVHAPPAAEGSCAIERPRVELWVEVTLPRRVGSSPPRRGVRLFQRALERRWDRYLEALRAHEEGHVAIGRRAAADLARALSSLQAQPTCALLDEAVEEAGRAAVVGMQLEHDRYDRATRHGLATGARFP